MPKKHGHTQWMPDKKLLKEPHPEVYITNLHDELVGIDEGLYGVITHMWGKGLDTQFCCEGYDWNHPEDGDEHSWSAMLYRGYILMPWTERTFEFVQTILRKFFRFSGNVPVNWDIEFATTTRFGGMNRICLRFPKSDIPHLLQFIKEHYYQGEI